MRCCITRRTSAAWSLGHTGSALITCTHSLHRIWELGVAVKVGSNLPDKVKISSELMRFGDQCRDVTDAVM